MNNNLNNIYEALEKAEFDKEVGISIAPLTGNSDFSLFAAEIAPNTKIGAHYHKHEHEIYQLLEGSGKMYTGIPDKNNKVKWNEPFEVKKGDCFTINEGVVHQLFNSSNQKMIVLFGCSKSHLENDRFVVKGIDV